MDTGAETKHYFLKFFPAMAVYLVATVGISLGEKHLGFAPSTLYWLSIVPILAVLVAMWVHWDYINRLDEYLFMIQVKGMMFGLAIVLALSASWGLLERLANAPHFDLIFITVVFAFAYSFATIYLTYRGRGSQR